MVNWWQSGEIMPAKGFSTLTPLGYELINNTWQPTTYTCSGEQVAVSGGTWCRAEATGTLDAQATAYLGYTCQWHATTGSYKCGCQDSSCTAPLWHAQQIQ